MERWVDICDDDSRLVGLYQVSTHGRIKRVTPARGTYPGRILAELPDKNGYRQINLHVGKKVCLRRKVHRIVCRTFHGDPSDCQMEVNHRDGDKQNNRPDNLEWCTKKCNQRHSFSIRKRVRKLSFAEYVVVFLLAEKLSAADTASFLKVSVPRIKQIRRAGIWSLASMGFSDSEVKECAELVRSALEIVNCKRPNVSMEKAKE